MIQFFAPDIHQTLSLPESDSAHCVRVLRMKTGDVIQVVDGKDHVFRCRIVDAHPKHTAVQIIESQTILPVWNNRIIIAVAPTKNMDRMEWLVEKLVETGVDAIIPIKCRYSERRDIKTERLVKIAVSAMKQSLKARLPLITPIMPIESFLADVNTPQRFMGYCSDTVQRRLLAREYKPDEDVSILIGPEGDFSEHEVQAAIGAGFVPVTMGNNRLRTETAALVACDTCHIINQLHGSESNV